MVSVFKKVVACALLLMVQSQVFSVRYVAVLDQMSSKAAFDFNPEDGGESVRVQYPIVLTRMLQRDEEAVITFVDSDQLATFIRVFADAIASASKKGVIDDMELSFINDEPESK